MIADLRALGAWFERQKRVLPWRNDPSLYRVWISEIMLQQTQVVTVVPYFEKFVARFPTVEALAAAPVEEVLLHWAGLGYYSRARNIHRGAQAIVANARSAEPPRAAFGPSGEKARMAFSYSENGFPLTREGWLEIPGVGPYTAGAILSIALGLPEAILDGNVERVVSRLRRVGRGLGDGFYKQRLWRLSGLGVREADRAGVSPSVFNQALMELGATVCTPRAPRCGECPVARSCRARAAGVVEAYPPRKKRKEWKLVSEELHCVLDGRGRVLLRERGPGEWRAGLWDLLDHPPAATSERVGEVTTQHVVTTHKITRVTQVWRVRDLKWSASEPELGLRWIDPSSPTVAIGSALKRTLEAVFR